MADVPVEMTSEEVLAVPRKVGHARYDLILAVAAILMSAISLVVAIQNSVVQRELLAGSTWPFVQRNISSLKDGFITIGIANDGVGPAKVRSVEVFFDGRPVRSTPDLLRACCGYRPDVPTRLQLPKGFIGSEADNTVLRAGETNDMIRIPVIADGSDIHRELSKALARITFRGCYCSVLDRCWTSDLASIRTQPVDACPAPAHPFEPNRR